MNCSFDETSGFPAVCVKCGRVVRAGVFPIYARCRSSDIDNAPSREPPDLRRTDAPTFIEKVKNFATATAAHVAAGMPMASDREVIRRHDICLGCEFLQDNACTQCGCPVSRVKGYVSKLSWADQECPAGKWGRETRESHVDP